MKKLSPNQIFAIQELAEYPVLISYVDIEFASNGTSRITIVSEMNVEWNDVDKAINEELDEVFPGLEYFGEPIKYSHPIEDETRELYFINFEGESLIRLMMRSGEPIEWTLEEILKREG